MPIPFARPQSDQEHATRAHPIPARSAVPPGDHHATAQLHEHLAASREVLDHLARALRELHNGPRVLESKTAVIPASGVYAADHYRIPVAAVAILNNTAAVLTVAAGPPQGSAPGGGQGQFPVAANSFVAWNMEAAELSIYGTPGTVFAYTAFADFIQPSAATI